MGAPEAVVGGLNDLVGLWFHVRSVDGTIDSQGEVLGSPTPGWYLIEIRGWIDGGVTDIRVAQIEAMANWSFYRSAEEMREAFEREEGKDEPDG